MNKDRSLPVILRAVEIDPDAVYWLISDGNADEYGIEWEYEFYIEAEAISSPGQG